MLPRSRRTASRQPSNTCHADDALGGDREWERIEAGVRTAIPVGKHFMWISLAGGADLGDELPADRAFSLGGPTHAPGVPAR